MSTLFRVAPNAGVESATRAGYLDPGLCWTGHSGAPSVARHHNLTRPKSYHLKKVTS